MNTLSFNTIPTLYEKIYKTAKGDLHYWKNDFKPSMATLVFLPGLTADHHLFEKQIEHFTNDYNIIVWNAPGHGLSRPFAMNFSLFDLAEWLHGILTENEISKPILIGQSMGGFIAQVYIDRYPNATCAFIAIDSAPMQRKYYNHFELWLLNYMEPLYRLFSWRTLLNSVPKGCAKSTYGRQLMYNMIMSYSKKDYCALIGYNYKIIAQAVKSSRQFGIDCPILLICGKNDIAGSCKRYNQTWHKTAGHPLQWIEGAGHNSNTDQPEEVNSAIAAFIQKIATKIIKH